MGTVYGQEAQYGNSACGDDQSFGNDFFYDLFHVLLSSTLSFLFLLTGHLPA